MVRRGWCEERFDGITIVQMMENLIRYKDF